MWFSSQEETLAREIKMIANLEDSTTCCCQVGSSVVLRSGAPQLPSEPPGRTLGDSVPFRETSEAVDAS